MTSVQGLAHWSGCVIRSSPFIRAASPTGTVASVWPTQWPVRGTRWPPTELGHGDHAHSGEECVVLLLGHLLRTERREQSHSRGCFVIVEDFAVELGFLSPQIWFPPASEQTYLCGQPEAAAGVHAAQAAQSSPAEARPFPPARPWLCCVSHYLPSSSAHSAPTLVLFT